MAWGTEALGTFVLQCSDNHHDQATCSSHIHTHINHTSLIAQWNHHQPNQSMKDCDILRQPTAAHVLPCALSAAASELSVLVLPPWLQVTCANSTVGFCASNEPHAAWPHSPEHVIPYRGSQGYHLITLDLYTIIIIYIIHIYIINCILIIHTWLFTPTSVAVFP